MKYSTLFIIISVLLIFFPWTGLPFGFIRLVISGIGLMICFLSVGLYQKEQKISELLHDLRNRDYVTAARESVESRVVHVDVVTENETVVRKKLSDVL